MPHGQCYLWNTDLLRLHGISDSLIALAYFSIPLTLLYVVRRRRDLPYPGLFLLFGGFIVACGTTHLLEVVTLWHPYYWLTGTVKAATAAISLVTAVSLVRIVPLALALPSPEDLRQLNLELEAKVRLRTADLSQSNAELRREIHQRQEAEREVQRLNASLQERLDEISALFEILPVGVGIATDASGRNIRTNRALAQMLALPENTNASLTAPAAEAPQNFKVFIEGHEVEPANLPMQRALRDNPPVVAVEETILRDDGARIIVIANAVPLQDDQGACRGCVATFHDVTQLKAGSEANARYAAIIASSEDAIIGKSLDGTVTNWNPSAERLFGYTATEMIGQSITRLFPEERLQEEQGIQQQILAGRLVPLFETVRRRKDGSLVEVAVTISPIHDREGRVIGASTNARDITERRQAAAEKQALDRKLLESQKLESLGVLAGGIAHDFNNLLTGILGNASLVRMDLPPASPILPAIAQIEISTHRAADLCKQMLAYSGKGRFVVQQLDLNHLVEETTHLLSISISKSCVLRYNLTPALPAVSADATQIRQIIMNLVINASEAVGTRSGVIALTTGVVRVDAEYIATLRYLGDIVPGDCVFLEVSDTGSGMDADTLAKIFDPFFTTKFTGRGLGLAAVLGIIRGHRGALKVYSEPGRGSTFKILLPCSGAAPDTPETSRPAAQAPWRGQGTVLVVDDEETVRTVSARILESVGFSVVLAADGREAMEKYRLEPPRYALVLLDLTMPHLDGEETFRQLRHLNPNVKVVLMSGFNQQEAVGRFTGKGLAGFVQKPFAVETVINAVRQVLLQA
jgi:PAS domain S-box-containing protein